MSIQYTNYDSNCPDAGSANPAWDHWYDQAHCQGLGDEMHVTGAEQVSRKRVCAGCPVKTPCLAEGLDGEYTGVWGGMTDRERNALKKRRPNVKSWTRLLAAAEKEHNRAAARVNSVTVMAMIPRQSVEHKDAAPVLT